MSKLRDKKTYTENIFKSIANIILSPVLKRALIQGKKQSKDVDPELSFLIQSLEMDWQALDRYWQQRCKDRDTPFCNRYRAKTNIKKLRGK